jgi:redox-sensitive bicupin YhaK (pirin superfamily)
MPTLFTTTCARHGSSAGACRCAAAKGAPAFNKTSTQGQAAKSAGCIGKGRMVVLAGTPWREPLVMHGPFGMSNQAELQAAMARYQAGEMGRLLPQPL